jgi:uncharacterized membrane protein YhaH (DUF805 family)
MALFFDSAGRVGRAGFMVKVGALIAILAIYDQLAHGEVRVLTGWLVEWPLFFAAACVLCQRLHDCGRSGWWGLIILPAFCVAWPQPHDGPSFAALGITLASGLGLCLMPGEPQLNRYGPRT